MKSIVYSTLDGNEAVARVAYALNEVIALYPITPATPMGEWADTWAAAGRKNLWGSVPSIVEMQSEGGAAGVVHGALQTGALCTTFTSSQGLLLMIPNMYKIAGELTAAVFHIAARSVATHALSIFGDHSDVMAARATGWAMLCSASVQEAHDFALIATAAALESRIPVMHFFDGFRTSHEIAKIQILSEEQIRSMIDDELVIAHRLRALSPDHPVLRGTAQNPDVFFQSRERINPIYEEGRKIMQRTMDRFAEITGRQYSNFEYHGAPDATRVVVLMGSGCEAVHETVDFLNGHSQKVGFIKVRLYRPFDSSAFVSTLPATVRAVAVLDRTKEPGSAAEPLYLDCAHALYHSSIRPKIVGGRYGLSSKEFTPAMIRAVFDNLAASEPKDHFTIGIHDDVSCSSLNYDAEISVEEDDVFRALFFGLGSDGTVGANKEAIKIIGESTDQFAQGYFVYDSKKSGAVTISHLRISPRPIRSSYLVTGANFVGCHQPMLLQRSDILEHLAPHGIFLLNTPYGPEKVWKQLPERVQRRLIESKARMFVIDAHRVASECGISGRINTIMESGFFAVSNVLPIETAMNGIRESIRKTYAKKGEEIVQMNLAAAECALTSLHEVKVPATPDSVVQIAAPVPETAPPFVRTVLGKIMEGRGNELPVSALPLDGTFPTGTTRWEKRNIADEVPVWDPDICIQCGKCVFVCPHAAIRGKVYTPSLLDQAPSGFKSRDARLPEWKELKYTLQVAVEDCTGCGICVEVCPIRNKSEPGLKAINMRPQPPLREVERVNWDFFLALPEVDHRQLQLRSVREQHVEQPLFEFSAACAGCGETPYIRLLTQLFGDRLLIANATGCSSIYGGNLPSTPYARNSEGRGPVWSNSLFEDNAEFGLGFRVSIDKQRQFAGELLQKLRGKVGPDLAEDILNAPQINEADIHEQRVRSAELRTRLAALPDVEARCLLPLVDLFVRRSVWIVGGDGWAYDIGFGGLDHVLASGADVKVLVLDTEVYSNTGGQCSKATPRGAVARFAAAGKRTAKKDLGLLAMSYGNIYVASVALGAKDEHTLRAFIEAEAYQGPALIIAYCHCIAHGIEMSTGLHAQKAAVNSGEWLLYRYNPERRAAGLNPLQLDSTPPQIQVEEYFRLENRFRLLNRSRPDEARLLTAAAQDDVGERRRLYEFLAGNDVHKPGNSSF